MSRSKGKKKKRKSAKNSKNKGDAISVPFGIKNVAKHPKYNRYKKFDLKLFTLIHKHPDNKKYQKEYIKFIFEPNIWGKYNKEYQIKFQASKIKGMRILIQITTINAILSGKYVIYNNNTCNTITNNIQTNNTDIDNDDNKNDDNNNNNVSKCKTIVIPKKDIIKSVSATVLHTENELFSNNFFNNNNNIIQINNNNSPKILIINNDILDVSHYIMYKYHVKPLILVMSSRSYPGGGYKKGSGASEEDMCRRSSLFCNLEDPYLYCKNKRFWSYPLPEFGGIYSPNVIVFRNGINKNYSFYDNHPLKMSFVSVYSYSSPNLDINNRLSKSMEKRIFKKIETILRIAIKHKYKCLILSAFGSGAYENPPKHVAQLFKRALLNTPEYNNYFEMIIFAILDDKNTKKLHNPNGNILPYSQVFNIPIVKLADSP